MTDRDDDLEYYDDDDINDIYDDLDDDDDDDESLKKPAFGRSPDVKPFTPASSSRPGASSTPGSGFGRSTSGLPGRSSEDSSSSSYSSRPSANPTSSPYTRSSSDSGGRSGFSSPPPRTPASGSSTSSNPFTRSGDSDSSSSGSGNMPRTGSSYGGSSGQPGSASRQSSSASSYGGGRDSDSSGRSGYGSSASSSTPRSGADTTGRSSFSSGSSSTPPSSKPPSSGFSSQSTSSTSGSKDSKSTDKASSGGFGQKLGAIRDKMPFGGGDKSSKPAATRSSATSASSGGFGQKLGAIRDKMPFGSGDKSSKPAATRSSATSASSGGFGQKLGAIRDKMPFGGGDKSSKPTATAASSSRAPSPGMGSRAGSSTSTSASATAAKSEGGGLLSKINLPFLNRGESTSRRASTREKLERASKAPTLDESGLSLDNKLDILGVVLILGALALVFSSMSATKGQLTEAVNTFFSQLLGTGALAVPLVMFAVGIWLVIRHFGDEAPIIDPVRIGGVGLLYIGLLLIFQFIESFNPAYVNIDPRNPAQLRIQLELSSVNGHGGGYLGSEIYYMLVTNLGEAGMVVIMVGLLLIGAMLLLRLSAAEVAIFFISLWRSFVASQQRRAQTREARARMAAAQLAAATEAQVSVTRPATAELASGQTANTPALPATSDAASQEEARPIPITMGGRTVTAMFGQEESVPVGNQPAAATASTTATAGGSLAGRLLGNVPGLRRNNDPQPEKSNSGSGAIPAIAGGLMGSLLNRNNGQTQPAPTANTPTAQPAQPQQPAATTTATAPATSSAQTATPLHAASTPEPSAVHQAAPATSETSAQPTPPPTRISDLLRATPTTQAAPDTTTTTPQTTSQASATPAPWGTGTTAQPAASTNTLNDRQDRLNALRSGQNAHPLGSPSPATTTPAVTRSAPVINYVEDTPAATEPEKSASPAFGKPSGPPVQQPLPRKRRNWTLPDHRQLLHVGSESDFDRETLLKQAKTIEETLLSFGAPGRVVEVNTGPVITQFGVEPDYLTSRSGKKSRVKVGAIAQLDKDLQLALGAKSIRIEAPVPGKGYVGIEVPNQEASIVSLRDVMESEQFQKIKAKSPLAIALGQSVDGTPIAADLSAMPHLLIAGTTGSGKSVLVNAIIASILVGNPPDRVKFIMVDPKRVELTGYNGIPHLVAPVVVDLERATGVLKWVTREMDERYKLFSGVGARNIEDYNKHLPADQEPMPFIVVIIDELADLMMMAPDETERVITRIAALARATGIHLVIATQRPSVDVVTGLIKANFPARVAFAVAGGVDSRVILDQPGAEKLLGKGDMLYLSGNAPAPLRLQGVWVSEPEISNITSYWKRQNAEIPDPQPLRTVILDNSDDEDDAPAAPVRAATAAHSQPTFWADEFDDDDVDLHDRVKDERDELYDQAVEMVRRLNKASVSLLQRRLRIGYTRAARLIDMMEAEGVVGPAQEGSKPREVLPPTT